MKKIFSIAAIIAITTLSLKAQISEGYIIYDMKMEGLSSEEASMMGDMETKMTFKNAKSLVEINSMVYTQQICMDEKGGMLSLIEVMGNKMATKMTKEEIDKEASKSKEKNIVPKIEYTSETKTIAGYECKKAIISYSTKDKKEVKNDVWYCDKFANQNMNSGRGQSLYKDIKGLIFEFTNEQSGRKMKMVAKEVSVDPVSDSKFNLSTDGYKLMTMEELKAMQGGK